jgi:hypothetical protein
MSAVAQSFANLVKTNNGLFKSPAQAAFLLSQCTDNEYTASGTVYGKGYTLFYTCDDMGVVKVQKQTVAKGLTTQWERVTEGQVSTQDLKEIKRIKRMIKQTELSMASRTLAREQGQYPNELLFKEAQDRDLQGLQTLQKMLANFA